jgi:FkbM family methyltransferase
MRRATILWLLLLILLHAAIGRNIRSVVFDVGFNDGLDTASFLAQGFRVVAVEANAGLVLAFSKKEPFSSALADGRLVLLNVAITNQTGVNVTFYINHLDPKLSTMDPRHFAGMAGRPKPAPVSVPGATCAGLLSRYGVPHYLKVDIEGFDETQNDFKDVALMQHFIMEQLPAAKRFSMRNQFFMFDEAGVTEKVNPILTLICM